MPAAILDRAHASGQGPPSGPASGLEKWAAQLLSRAGCAPPATADVEHRRLAGGLESGDAIQWTARYRDGDGRHRKQTHVFKELRGRAVREAAVYQRLATRHAAGASPRVLGVEHAGPDRALLWLQALRRTCAWPWKDPTHGRALLGRLASFHRQSRADASEMPPWDFESEFEVMAEATAEAVERCGFDDELRFIAEDAPAVRHLALSARTLRQEVLSGAGLAVGPIHGDVHPGNAIVCRRGRGAEALLLDWGRARIGSPLEDVASWLQSLGARDEATRTTREDLLAHYLGELGRDRKVTPSLRAAYWIAAASNALSGALLHHVCMAETERPWSARRAAEARIAGDWASSIRSAAAIFG